MVAKLKDTTTIRYQRYSVSHQLHSIIVKKTGATQQAAKFLSPSGYLSETMEPRPGPYPRF